MDNPQFIVAEISKSWPNIDMLPIRALFEKIIAFNLDRGYELHSWNLAATERVMRYDKKTKWIEEHNVIRTETIVAVFKRI